MSSSIATTASNRFIAPYVASMDADGSANFVYVQQETVSITGIDYQFDVTLDEALTKKLLEAFTVSGHGVDDDANVTLEAPQDLQDVLKEVINGASFEAKRAVGADDIGVTEQLRRDLWAGLYAAIGADNLVNTVENLDVTDVSVIVDSSGGAADMASEMTDDRATVIYTQIPAAGLNVYMDASSEEQDTSALPLSGGDVLTFVFDIDLSNVVPSKSQVDITGTEGTAVEGKYTSGLHFNLASKRCAFNLTMAGTGKISGLKA
jgi:hypothetical protein